MQKSKLFINHLLLKPFKTTWTGTHTKLNMNIGCPSKPNKIGHPIHKPSHSYGPELPKATLPYNICFPCSRLNWFLNYVHILKCIHLLYMYLGQ